MTIKGSIKVSWDVSRVSVLGHDKGLKASNGMNLSCYAKTTIKSVTWLPQEWLISLGIPFIILLFQYLLRDKQALSLVLWCQGILASFTDPFFIVFRVVSCIFLGNKQVLGRISLTSWFKHTLCTLHNFMRILHELNDKLDDACLITWTRTLMHFIAWFQDKGSKEEPR